VSSKEIKDFSIRLMTGRLPHPHQRENHKRAENQLNFRGTQQAVLSGKSSHSNKLLPSRTAAGFADISNSARSGICKLRKSGMPITALAVRHR
jgi:hypothetical protein